MASPSNWRRQCRLPISSTTRRWRGPEPSKPGATPSVRADRKDACAVPVRSETSGLPAAKNGRQEERHADAHQDEEDDRDGRTVAIAKREKGLLIHVQG